MRGTDADPFLQAHSQHGNKDLLDLAGKPFAVQFQGPVDIANGLQRYIRDPQDIYMLASTRSATSTLRQAVVQKVKSVSCMKAV
jgi:hypothetical protein